MQHHLYIDTTERASEMLLFDLLHAARTALVATRDQRKLASRGASAADGQAVVDPSHVVLVVVCRPA